MSAGELLARIAAEKEAFDLETSSRRAWFVERWQWVRLARHYQAVRKRYERRFKRPIYIAARPVDTSTWGNDYLVCGDDGVLLSNALNAQYCLEHHPDLAGLFRLDKMTGKMMRMAPLPNERTELLEDFDTLPVTQGDVTAVQVFLQSIGLLTISREDVGAAIKRVARLNAFLGGGDDGERDSVSGQDPALPLS